MYRACGDAFALPPPSLGVSSLDLGRWHASGLFLLGRKGLVCLSGRSLARTMGGDHEGLRKAHGRYRHFAIEFCALRSDVIAVR
jgi:hypothetical protein